MNYGGIRAREESVIKITKNDTLNFFKAVKVGNSGRHNKVTGKVLKVCDESLCRILTDLFQQSIDSHTVPTLWKTSEIIPVPKIKNSKTMNDYRTIALTLCYNEKFLKNN